MTKIARAWVRAGAVALLALSGAAAFAQQAPQMPPAKAPANPAPKAPAAAAAPAAASGEAALRQRIEQLEEQLVDLQVVVGTLESLARGAAAPAPGPGRVAPGAVAAAADAGRLDGIETQIRALAAQLEQVQEQMRTLGAGAPRPPEAATEPPPAAAGPRPGRPRAEAEAAQPERTGFGAVTVSPDGRKDDEIDRILNTPQPPRPGLGPPPGLGPGQSPGPGPGPAVAAAEPDSTPKQLYETAYGYLLQRDYGAAEAAFEEFLRRHPGDPLAGNAQYWLGESLYVRGQYRAAAGAFLKGYQTYTKSAKAPENLLKLAMSLQRLGQKDAACSSFNELASKYPSAPNHVKTTAQNERQRAGC
jgi:tol-pal system protein YbgF